MIKGVWIVLPLSNLTIKFNQSKDYPRLAWGIHLVAIITLYCVHCSAAYWIVACCLLSWPMMTIICSKMPHPELHALSYHRQFWLLHGVNDQTMKYEKMQIRFDTGFFLLMVLYGINRRRHVVIFRDQITQDECRMLHIIEKIG